MATASSQERQGSWRRRVAETIGRWRLKTLYEQFEQLVALALSLIIAVIVLIALFQLYERTLPLALGGALDPLDHEAFQRLFGAIFTVMIAMEFKHSILRASQRRDSIVQVRTVVLIALLAMSRKFVILDPESVGGSTIAALALVTVALGLVYRFLRDDDARRR